MVSSIGMRGIEKSIMHIAREYVLVIRTEYFLDLIEIARIYATHYYEQLDAHKHRVLTLGGEHMTARDVAVVCGRQDRHWSTVGSRFAKSLTSATRPRNSRVIIALSAALVTPMLAGRAHGVTPTPVPQLACESSSVPDCPVPNTSTTVQIETCAELNGFSFTASNQRINLQFDSAQNDECGLTHPIVITGSHVYIRGQSGRIRLYADYTPAADSAGIRISGNDVRVERVSVEEFPNGIRVDDGKTDAVLDNLTVSDNNYGMKIAGDDVCMFNVTAENNNQVGILVESTAGKSFAFRGGDVNKNFAEGLRIDSTALTDVHFWSVHFNRNGGDGLTVKGQDAEVLCADLSRNEARGLVSSAAKLQVENAYIYDNTGVGVALTAASTVNHIIGATILDNDGGLAPGSGHSGKQISRTSGTLRVYNTLTRGKIFIDSGTGTTECGGSMYADLTSACASGTPGIVKALPTMDVDGRKLKTGSRGVDEGADVRPTAKPTLVVRIPQEDREGHVRPVDGNGDGSAIVDIGAYEIDAPATSTLTWTPTFTATRTPTPIGPTSTFTPTPTATTTPCSATSCAGDCTICDNVVTVSELVREVNWALGAPATGRQCIDKNLDLNVTIDELVKAVNRLLYNCPAPAGGDGDGGGAASVDGGDAEIVIPPLTARRGMSFAFSVMVQQGDGQAAAFNADIGYPTTVMTAPKCTSDPRLPGGLQLTASSPSSGVLRLMLMNLGEYPVPPFPDGIVAKCSAMVLSNAPLGNQTLSAGAVVVTDQWGDVLGTAGINGTLTVTN